MTYIIAFAGRKQSGKTTCAEASLSFFKAQMNLSGKIYNFADPLKQDICMNILGMTYNQCYGDDVDKNTLTDMYWNNTNLTAREAMQFLGTDIFRSLKNNVWAGATIKKISLEQPEVAVIADCRFPNEVEAVKSAGGYVIKLTRNPYNSTHSSEIALDPENYDSKNFDLVINNNTIDINQQTQIVFSFLSSLLNNKN